MALCAEPAGSDLRSIKTRPIVLSLTGLACLVSPMDRFVARQNIEHFHQQLAAERDPAKRAQLQTLLREAELQLREAEAAHASTSRPERSRA